MAIVTLTGWPQPITVEAGETILDAALAAGVPFPHGCRSGNCGACKSRVLSGDVDLAPVSEYALSDAERQAGLVLACRSLAWEDCSLAWLEADAVALHRLCRLETRVQSVTPLTHDTVEVALAIDAGGPFTFTAGQYASLSFPGLPPRDYSMANAPDEAVLRFHIRRVPGGAVSVYATQALTPGTMVTVEGPFGTAHLRSDHTGPVLAIAGGSGLAPIQSIVTSLLASDPQRAVFLYHGVRTPADAYGSAWLADLTRSDHVTTHVEVAADGLMLHQRIAADFAAGLPAGAKAYVAGPPAMVDAVSAVLHSLGLAQADIHADAFYTSADRPAVAAS